MAVLRIIYVSKIGEGTGEEREVRGCDQNGPNFRCISEYSIAAKYCECAFFISYLMDDFQATKLSQSLALSERRNHNQD